MEKTLMLQISKIIIFRM